MHVSKYIYIYIYTHLSLSLYIYIYIHMYCVFIHIYIYIYICGISIGRRVGTVGNPPRAQTVQCELFEFVLFLTLGEQFPVERFEANTSHSTVPFPPLNLRSLCRCCGSAMLTILAYLLQQ